MSFNSTPKELIEQNINGLLSIHDSWQRISMDLIAKITNGFAFKSSEFNNRKDGVPLVRIRDVLKGNTSTYYSGQVPEGYWIYIEDLIVGMDGDFNTTIWRSVPALLNQRVCKIEVNEENYNKRFFFHVLPGYLSAINANTSSVTVKHLSSKTLQETLFPLPPLAEQKIISEKLDTLLEQVDSTKARLEKIPKILKRFRQAILAIAINGKLTDDWRKNNPSICTEWNKTNIGELAQVATGKTPKRTDSRYWENGSIPWLTSSSTGKAFVEVADQFVSDLALRECSLKIFCPGTLLLAMYGEGKTRGQVTELKISATCNQACAAITCDEDKINRNFLKMLLMENYQETRKAAAGGNQPNLNLNKVREITIALPSLSEQHEIVHRVEQLFAYADTIEKQVNSALSRVNNLTQSILAKAFRGELTAQWRAENPELISGENSAAALLEKIKAERATSTGKKASRKKS